MTVVTCSMHKQPIAGADILNRMVQEVPDTVVIANIGRSNGAGPTLSALTTTPVITVPASVREFPDDVWSSLRAPSSVPVMTVLEPSNAVLAAFSIASRNWAVAAGQSGHCAAVSLAFAFRASRNGGKSLSCRMNRTTAASSWRSATNALRPCTMYSSWPVIL